MLTIVSNFTLDIRYRNRRIFLKLIFRHLIRNFIHGRRQLPNWWEAETTDILCNLIQINFVELRPPHSMSVRQADRHAQLILQSPLKDREN